MIVPAYRSAATLPAVLAALRPQIEGRSREAVVVESSGGGAGAEVERIAPWARVIALEERTLPGRARNLGIEAARGELLAFLDADAVPEPNWLDRLEHALGPGVDAAAGAVLNGTPQSAVGTAGFLLEFSELLPGRRSPIVHGATCNLLVRRQVLEAGGGFLESVWPGEDTILTFRLAERGRLAFAPDACVRHLNRTAFAEFLRHQQRLGASFCEVCRRVDFPYRRVGRPALAPLAFLLRLGALAKRLVRHPREAALAAALFPLLLIGLAAWSAGLAGARR